MSDQLQARIDANWKAIQIELDAPRPAKIERLLLRIGMPATLTRLLVSTPGLRRAWFIAVGLTVLISLGSMDAGRPRDSLLTLLVLAPLVPVLGVALAYGPSSDPAHEVAVSTPISGLRLVLTRAAAVLGATVVLLGLASLVAQPALMALAWLAPAFGLTMVSVATMTVLSPRRATSAVAFGWMVAVLGARTIAGDPLAAFTIGGQLVALAVGAAGLWVAVGRRASFDVMVIE